MDCIGPPRKVLCLVNKLLARSLQATFVHQLRRPSKET
jgi:hypothetical protein